MSIIQENTSTVHKLDEILYAGNDLYRVRIGKVQYTVKSFLQMLSFEGLPRKVSMTSFRNKRFEQICITVMHINYERSENVLNLSQGSKLLFSSYRQGYIIVGGICSTMYKDANNRFVFLDTVIHLVKLVFQVLMEQQ